jgi:hypothetical protein
MDIHVCPLGNMGNRALQYLAAEQIRRYAPKAQISHLHLPEWGIQLAAERSSGARTLKLGQNRMWIDVAGLGDCLNRGVIDTVVMDSYAQHLENFPPRDVARRLLPMVLGGAEAEGFGPHELVCSLRGGEVLRRAHPDYMVLPAEFYQMLADQTGLQLVFFGQVGTDRYTEGLQRALPEARFVAGQDALHDFEVLRRSANIVPSISTFSWLAAWLSEAARIILPVAGFLNPAQVPLKNFLPLGDATFQYVLFPVSHAVDLWQEPQRFDLVQENLARHMTHVSVAQLRGIQQRVSRNAPIPLLAGFDPEYYLAVYPDVNAIVQRNVTSAAEHYLESGFNESRLPFALDEAFYFANYPDAALSVMQGQHVSAFHHYTAVGYASGYRCQP